jgi:hypothetical protein
LPTVVAKFWAALLVCLCLLPTTAPFSTLDPVDCPAGPHSAPVIGTLTAAAFATSADDNDALVVEPLHRSQSRSGELAVVASSEGVVVAESCLPLAGLPCPGIASAPLIAVLRL